VQVFAQGSGRPVLTSSFLQLTESRPALSAVIPKPAPGVAVTTASLPDVANFLQGIGPPLPGRLAGLARTPIHGGLTTVAAYGTGFTRFAVIPLPGRTGTQALSAAQAAGAPLFGLQDGTDVLIRTQLLTVALASSSLGGPVFLLAGPVTPAVLQRAAPGVLVRSVILP
jgi:hypothetical protein